VSLANCRLVSVDPSCVLVYLNKSFRDFCIRRASLKVAISVCR